MFVKPHRLYLVNIFSGITRGNLPRTSARTCKSSATSGHMHTHVDAHTYTHSGGKMALASWSEAFVAQLFSIQTSCSSFSISFVFGHTKSFQSAFFIFSFLYSQGLSGCWFYEWFLFFLPCSSCSKLISSRVLTHLDCFHVRGGMMHISRMLSLGWRAKFLPI